MAKETGEALAERSATMIEPTAALVDQAERAILDHEMPPEVGDPAVTARAIAERIRQGQRFMDVFSPQKPLTPWREYLDEPVIVYGFHLNPSAFEQGSAVYAVVELGHKQSGEVETVSCGGSNVLMQLVQAWKQGWFPISVKLTAKGTARGFDALWLESA